MIRKKGGDIMKMYLNDIDDMIYGDDDQSHVSSR